MGSKNTPQVPKNIQTTQNAAGSALSGIASQVAQQSSQLYNLTEPGVAQAENFYSTLSSGDPYAIQRAIAPATQQIEAATASAKSNIMNNAPAGGEKNLALEQADVNQGAQVGNVASQGYLGSFNALGQLGAQGIGLSQGAAGLGISGQSAAGNISLEQGTQSLEAQQLALQQKGQTLGALGGLAGDAATLGGAGITSSATKGLTAALAA